MRFKGWKEVKPLWAFLLPTMCHYPSICFWGELKCTFLHRNDNQCILVWMLILNPSASMLCILAVGTNWTRNTGKVFPEEPLGSTPTCQQGWGFFVKPNLSHVGTSLSVGPHQGTGDSGKGRAMGALCVLGVRHSGLQLDSNALKSQQTWAPWFGRGEVVRSCDFFTIFIFEACGIE